MANLNSTWHKFSLIGFHLGYLMILLKCIYDDVTPQPQYIWATAKPRFLLPINPVGPNHPVCLQHSLILYMPLPLPAASTLLPHLYPGNSYSSCKTHLKYPIFCEFFSYYSMLDSFVKQSYLLSYDIHKAKKSSCHPSVSSLE